MALKEQEGPKEEVVPEQRYMSCSGCKFLDHHMTRSGMDPIYANNCKHPKLPLDHQVSSLSMHGNLPNRRGQIHTPEWCPVRVERRAKIQQPSEPITPEDFGGSDFPDLRL